MVHVQGINVRRIAAIDIGTNTFHLLIVDINDNNDASLVFQDTIAVKLGEGGINKGYITDAAFERGIKAITNFKHSIVHYHCEEIRTAATSALRSANNGDAFLDQVLNLTGIHLRIIDGQEEAKLIYQGVKKAVDLKDLSLVMDIGGGSVEFIIADDKQIHWMKSFPIGAARLMDRFHHSDPISSLDIGNTRKYLDEELPELYQKLATYQPKILIGSAGSFETLALFQDHTFEAGFYAKNMVFDMEKYRGTSEFIIRSTHDERLKDQRIATVRVDMIVVAALLTNHILQKSGIKEMQLSSYSLKEGLLFSKGF